MCITKFFFYVLLSGCGISLAKQVAQRRIVGGDDAGFGNLYKHFSLELFACLLSLHRDKIIKFQVTFLGKLTSVSDRQGMNELFQSK